METQALRVRQKDKEVYLFALKAGDLLKRYHVDRVGVSNPDGYQRPLREARLREIMRYLDKEEGDFPTSILLNIREREGVAFNSVSKVDEGVEKGILVIPEDKTLWLVDGQHRLEGIKYSIEKGLEWLTNYPLLVSLFVGLERYNEMREFYVVNTRQKGVQADVAERHLTQMMAIEGKLRLVELEGKAKFRQARALRIVDALRQRKDSPWLKAIRFPGEVKSPVHLVRQHTMVVAVKEIFKDPFIERLTDDQLSDLIIAYWQAIRELLPEAFTNPDSYSVQKIPGIYAFHMIFPDVFELCRESGDFSKERMKEVLGQMEDMKSEFWNIDSGHYLTKDTGMRSLRLLAEHLRGQLPEPSLPKLSS
jgi:DGQHR domain-containing protein